MQLQLPRLHLYIATAIFGKDYLLRMSIPSASYDFSATSSEMIPQAMEGRR